MAKCRATCTLCKQVQGRSGVCTLLLICFDNSVPAACAALQVSKQVLVSTFSESVPDVFGNKIAHGLLLTNARRQAFCFCRSCCLNSLQPLSPVSWQMLPDALHNHAVLCYRGVRCVKQRRETEQIGSEIYHNRPNRAVYQPFSDFGIWYIYWCFVLAIWLAITFTNQPCNTIRRLGSLRQRHSRAACGTRRSAIVTVRDQTYKLRRLSFVQTEWCMPSPPPQTTLQVCRG